MDISWVTDRIGLGGGIWNAKNMEDLALAGVTHVLNMQHEFDDSALAQAYGVQVLWNPTEDDFQVKPFELLNRGVEFAMSALQDPANKLYVHCAAGVHRAPMMTLAILCAMDWQIDAAMSMVQAKRPVVDFADAYVKSVRQFVELMGKNEMQASE
jgi:protein-tyrosine phosphatase